MFIVVWIKKSFCFVEILVVIYFIIYNYIKFILGVCLVMIFFIFDNFFKFFNMLFVNLFIYNII